jgi:putative Mg2+ transporter-C (MgtC) family protein
MHGGGIKPPCGHVNPPLPRRRAVETGIGGGGPQARRRSRGERVNELYESLQLPLLLRIFLAFVLGAAVGVERERRAKAAGLRTHMLVAAGAAMFTIASFAIFVGQGTVRDPARIAAQIVTGVGFLGAGAIIQSGSSVSGLTTAASIWVSAGIGMLAGGGAYSLAVASAVLTVLALRLPHKRLRPRKRDVDEPEDDEEG